MMAEKIEYKLEFLVRVSPKILYGRLSTPSGLSEWFADDVNIKNGIYYFEWDGAVEEAKLVSKKADQFIRFQWLEDEGTNYFFEFRITIDPLTKELALIITDFAEEDERDEAAMLWESQIDTLRHNLGA